MQQLCLSDSNPIRGVRLYTAAAVRELDRQAIAEYGVPGLTLMQRAGAFMFAQLQRRLACVKPADCSWLIFCGAGNNAGDGYIIAKLAAETGYQVTVVALHSADQLKGDARLVAQNWQQEHEVFDWQSYQSQLANTPFDLCIDALLGTGLDRPLQGIYRDAVEYLNRQTLVAAVDIPTGLCADTGAIASVAVNAAITCSFIGRKQGLYTAAGRDCCGEIFFSDLSVPQQIYSQVPANARLLGSAPEKLPPRSANSHKGSYGHVLLCGGQAGMSGAVMLAGEAALRAGAGVLTIATIAEHAGNINLARPELMVRATEDAAALELIAGKADVLVIGPGLGTGEWGRRCLQVLLQLDTDCDLRPLVVDADALNLLASQPVARGRWILTPHPAEAARLLGLTTAEVQADRFAAVRKLAVKYQAVVILKGSGTLIAAYEELTAAAEIPLDIHEDIHVDVCPFGNPGMATAGMGDVLTGVIAALLAQGMQPLAAARLAVVLHARAGDYLACKEGQIGLLAGDMPAAIRSLLNTHEG